MGTSPWLTFLIAASAPHVKNKPFHGHNRQAETFDAAVPRTIFISLSKKLFLKIKKINDKSVFDYNQTGKTKCLKQAYHKFNY